jgi:type VI secretion system protein ImpM
MSAPDLTPGLFGKLPSTGDFVTRRLPADFVRRWDPWVARYLAPWQNEELWDAGVGLRFLLGPRAFGPMAGVVMPSTDKVGRRFPLTVAVRLPSAATGLLSAGEEWFASIHQLSFAAQENRSSADELAAELAQLPFPFFSGGGQPVQGILLWVDPAELLIADPEAPHTALEYLLGQRREVN